MSSFPVLVRSVSPSGETQFGLGDPVVDRYLQFVRGRCRANTLRAKGTKKTKALPWPRTHTAIMTGVETVAEGDVPERQLDDAGTTCPHAGRTADLNRLAVGPGEG